MFHFPAGLHEVKRTKFLSFLSAVYKNTQDLLGPTTHGTAISGQKSAAAHYYDSLTRYLTSKGS